MPKSLGLEDADEAPRPEPYQRLWLMVLIQLLDDAARRRAGGKPRGGSRRDGEAALAQVVECGPELRFVCLMAGLNPVWVSEKFIAGTWPGRIGKLRGFPLRRGDSEDD